MLDPKTELLVELYGHRLYQTRYAILSHCWDVSDDGEREVLCKEMMKKITTMNGKKGRDQAFRSRSGTYKKVLDTRTQAQKYHLDWVWIDTCSIRRVALSYPRPSILCIWYANLTICYAYLHDAYSSGFPVDRDETMFGEFSRYQSGSCEGRLFKSLLPPTSSISSTRGGITLAIKNNGSLMNCTK